MLMLYSIVHVSMQTTKMTNFTFQSKFFISIFFTCQISACELQPFSCHDLANDIYSQTAKTVCSHLNREKCKIRQTQVPYVGHLLEAEGLKVDPHKVKAIKEMPEPKGKEDVKRVL